MLFKCNIKINKNFFKLVLYDRIHFLRQIKITFRAIRRNLNNNFHEITKEYRKRMLCLRERRSIASYRRGDICASWLSNQPQETSDRARNFLEWTLPTKWNYGMQAMQANRNMCIESAKLQSLPLDLSRDIPSDNCIKYTAAWKDHQLNIYSITWHMRQNRSIALILLDLSVCLLNVRLYLDRILSFC